MKNPTLPVKKPIPLLITLLFVALANVQLLRAATITVTNTNDSGAGSVRQALADANNGDTIEFSVTAPATITLTSGQLVVNKALTIDGPGANLLAVNGNANGRVFNIDSAVATISGITITGGRNIYGGGLAINHSSVTLSNCIVSSNSARTWGGGIFVTTDSELTLNNCVVSNNSSTDVRRGYTAGGGGIYANGSVRSRVTVIINNSTISGNSAGGGGGGISNFGLDGNGTGNFAHLFVNNSAITGNSADSGGGIFNASLRSFCRGCGATARINNSTISGNTAQGAGGGIFNESGRGYYDNAIVAVQNSTISDNSASLGGGIYNDGMLSVLSLGDTIFKTGSLGQNIYNVEDGRVRSLGYNLSSDNGSGLLTGPSDQINTDPMLSPLQNNGGPTFTHALLPGSPAIDHGNPGFTPPPDEDQRGCPFTRVFNSHIDVGSFESQPTPPPCPTPRPRPTPPPR